ncbi:MAG: pyridoxal phosphate-dependent aminotransferase [Bacteroidetes bacterium]|nr:pyridoxal phosphate-dependent aminotransferase [Bacteroidota bacterium]
MKNLYSKKIINLSPSPTLKLNALAKEMKDNGIDVVGLTAGEPDFPTPTHIKRAAMYAIQENYSKYTANCGIIELRKSIALKLQKENNITCNHENIIVTNGAKHAIYNALQSICNKGDEVIIGAPYWVSYPEMIKLADAKPIIINTNEKTNYKVTIQQLKKVISKKTKAFLFSTPSNPTGNVYSEDELREIAAIAKKYNFFIIADEIYEKLLYDGAKHFSIGSILDVKDLVLTVNGLSKSFAMTGWRLGYLCANKNIIQLADKLQGQMTSNASSISQMAAIEALNNRKSGEVIEAMRKVFEERRNYLFDVISSIPKITCTKPEGAFFLFPNVSNYLGKKFNGKIIKTVDALGEYFLNEVKLAFVPGSGFGSKNCFRISYAESMESLKIAGERLIQGFKNLK